MQKSIFINKTTKVTFLKYCKCFIFTVNVIEARSFILLLENRWRTRLIYSLLKNKGFFEEGRKFILLQKPNRYFPFPNIVTAAQEKCSDEKRMLQDVWKGLPDC